MELVLLFPEVAFCLLQFLVQVEKSFKFDALELLRDANVLEEIKLHEISQLLVLKELGLAFLLVQKEPRSENSYVDLLVVQTLRQFQHEVHLFKVHWLQSGPRVVVSHGPKTQLNSFLFVELEDLLLQISLLDSFLFV